MALEKFTYDNTLARNFAIATVVWAIVALLVGLIAAFAILWPEVSMKLPYLTFGRLRPLHTNAAIFAFVLNSVFTGVYYSMPRLLKTPMFSNVLGKLNFWGWQLIIVLAAVTLLAGITTGKEYAELEWPIDILIAAVWVIFGWNMIGTILQRRTKHIYVAIWFYIATFVTVTVLHIVNSFELPISLWKSYPVYAGVQDALVQWWYGHNAVAFVLTTPILGLMYYFIPKAANRPVYSYKLSVIHFWALIFLYIWAGPHHLLYQALPNWTQALGVVFSIALLAPSWGGMINGLLTLRGAWDRVREDPVLKFMVVAVTAYGLATFEGPMMALKSVNAITHYTDWTIAHVHIAALGWNGFLTFGILYWLVPRIFNIKLYSTKLANIHFWIGTLGILFYAIPLYWGAVTQFLMWKEFTDEGFLKYPNFLETLTQIVPMYHARIAGGTLYFIGVLMMVYNIIKTVKAGSFVKDEAAEAPALEKTRNARAKGEGWHRWLERRPIQFMILSMVVILIGGLVEVVPTYLIKSNIPTISSVKPYSPLELQGRDIYIRDGCHTCHTQMIRPFRSETERYGEYSKAGEFVYDHPFLFGSKRTGPDLAREGVVSGKCYKPDSWHYNHMKDPRIVSPQSLMPAYPWLITDDLDISTTARKIEVMQYMGVPYEEGYSQRANDELRLQAEKIAEGLKASGIDVDPDKEIIALIAYLQRLGTDIYKK